MQAYTSVASGESGHSFIQLLESHQPAVFVPNMWTPCSGEIGQLELFVVQLGIFVVVTEYLHEEHVFIDVFPPWIDA
ncbi:hypothetical protein ACZ87_03588, partial [Candidatus Erwinia dacicola]